MKIESIERARSHRRLGLGVAAGTATLVLLAAAVVVVKATRGPERQAISPASETITSADIGRLRLEWSADLGAAAAGPDRFEVYPPIVAGDRVIEATEPGAIYSFPVSCGTGGATCQGTLIGRTEGDIARAPTLADGTIYVTTAAGKLYAFPANCDASCGPSWVGETPNAPALDPLPWCCATADAFSAPPVVAEGMVFGTTDGGTMYAFRTDCGEQGATCEPAWTARLGHADLGRINTPIVINEVVYVRNGWDRIYAFDAATGRRLWIAQAADEVPHHLNPDLMAVQGGLLITDFGSATLEAFPLECTPSGGRCAPTWTAALPYDDAGYGFTPAAGDGVVVAESCCSGSRVSLAAFSSDCATGGAACTPLWTGRPEQAEVFPTVHDGTVFVTGGCTKGVCTSVVEAFDVNCATGGATCSPLWLWKVPKSLGRLYPPVFANDLLLVGTLGDGVLAFPTDCRTDGGTCRPAWSFDGASRAISSPAVAGGRLFAASADGTLYAFGLSPNG